MGSSLDRSPVAGGENFQSHLGEKDMASMRKSNAPNWIFAVPDVLVTLGPSVPVAD